MKRIAILSKWILIGQFIALFLHEFDEGALFFHSIAMSAMLILFIMHEPSILKKKWHVLNVKIPGKNHILIIKSKNLLASMVLITTFTILYISEGSFKGLSDWFGLNFSSITSTYSLLNVIITTIWFLAAIGYLAITTRISINSEDLTTYSVRKKDNEIDLNNKQA